MQISEVVTVPLMTTAGGSAPPSGILIMGQQPIAITTIHPLPGGLLVSQGGCAAASSSVAGGSLLEEPCRFPKLEECAHFHYERVHLPHLVVTMVESGSGMDLSLHSQHSSSMDDSSAGGTSPPTNLYTVQVQSGDECWLLQRTLENFRLLDAQLHQCIYDRKVSLLTDLAQIDDGGVESNRKRRSKRRSKVDDATEEDADGAVGVLKDYLRQLCIIADNSINCAPILNWLQMDNRGHRLLVPSEESRSINTPAVAAAYSVRRYVSQARDELSLEVGDMISVIDMASPGESVWWRGKRGFQVGFFPQYCVHIIGDKVPRNMPGPPPVVGSLAMSPIKPVLRKHGKLIAFFRSFILSRPSRRRLKATGILRERVFGCDLGEHLLNSGRRIPAVLRCCAEFIEAHGILDGIYRLSGVTSNIQKLRNAFDEDRVPNLYTEDILQDIHSVASLLKMYFRELPNPLCTYQLYTAFVQAIQGNNNPSSTNPTPSTSTSTPDSKRRLLAMRETVQKLPPPHYRTLAYLMRHLARVARYAGSTGMTTRNIAIVWAPNLLRCAELEVGGVAALQGVGVQAVVTEFLICYADLIFCDRLPSTTSNSSNPQCFEIKDIVTNGSDIGGAVTNVLQMTAQSPKRCRPKSLAIATPTKLITLEEARTKLGRNDCGYIEVGGGPDNLPKMYHTVIELPANHRKRSLNKRSPLTWRSFFSRTSRESRNARNQGTLNKARKTSTPNISLPISLQDKAITETDLSDIKRKLRTVKSAESLTSGHSEPNSSEMDLLAPLHSLHKSQGHNRSVSHDSYFDVLQSSHNNSEGSLLDLSEIQINFELEESEMRIFSEDESLVSSPRMQKNSATPHTNRRSHQASSSSATQTAHASPCSLGLPTTVSGGNQPSPKKQARLQQHHSNKHYAPQPPGSSTVIIGGRRAQVQHLLDNNSGDGSMMSDCLREYCPPNVTALGGGVTIVTSSASKRSKLEEQLSEDIAFIDSCTNSRGESPVGAMGAGGSNQSVQAVGGIRANMTITAAIVHRNYEPTNTVVINSNEPSQYYPHSPSTIGNVASINLSSTTPLFTPQTPGYMPLMTESSSPGTPNTPDTPLTDIAYQTLSGRSPAHEDAFSASSFGGRVRTPAHPPRRLISPAGSPVYENVLTTISITYKSPTRTFVTQPHPIMDAISTDNMAMKANCFEEDNVDIYEDVGENCEATIPTSVANLPIQQANENNHGDLVNISDEGRSRSLNALDEPRNNVGTPLTPDIDLLNNGQNLSLTDLSLSEVAQLDSTSRCCTSYSLPLTPEGANVSSLDALHLLLEEDQRTASADSEISNNTDFLSAPHNNHLNPTSTLRLSLDDIMAQSFNLIEFSPCVEQQNMVQEEHECNEVKSRPVSTSSDKRKSSERDDEQMLGCTSKSDDNEIYQQVKYLRRSVHEINSLVLENTHETNTQPHSVPVEYENVIFSNQQHIPQVPQQNKNVSNTAADDLERFDSLEPEVNPVFELHTAVEHTHENCEAQTQPFGVYENVDFYKDSLESEEVKPEVLHTALITSVDVLRSSNNSMNNIANVHQSTSINKVSNQCDIARTVTHHKDGNDENKRSVVGPIYDKDALPPCLRARNLKKHNLSVKTRSLDEDEFQREVMNDETTIAMSVQSLNRRKSFDDNFKVNSLPKSLNKPKRLPPLESIDQEHLLHELHSTTTKHTNSDDKQRTFDNTAQSATQQLNRERIERYKEERRRFLHEKYKSESFRITEKINQQESLKKEVEAKLVVTIEAKQPELKPVETSDQATSKSSSVRDTIRKLDSHSATLPDRSSVKSRTALFEPPILRSSLSASSQVSSNILLKRTSGQQQPGVDAPLVAGGERRRHTYEANARERDVGMEATVIHPQKQETSLVNRRTSLDERSKTAGGNAANNRKEKMSPSYNIRDMKAIFESKSQQYHQQQSSSVPRAAIQSLSSRYRTSKM